MAMRIQVIEVEHRRPPGWQLSSLRFIVLAGPGVVVSYLPFLDLVSQAVTVVWDLYLLITAVADPENRGFHDRVARTRVITTPSPVPEET